MPSFCRCRVLLRCPVTTPLSTPPAARDGLRERKKRELHRAIERQAFQLFLAQGFDATTIEQIAARVDISPRTFFRYFPTKEDALLAYAPMSLQRLLAILRSQPCEVDDVDVIRDAFVVLGSTIERYGETELVRARMVIEHRGAARALARDTGRVGTGNPPRPGGAECDGSTGTPGLSF